MGQFLMFREQVFNVAGVCRHLASCRASLASYPADVAMARCIYDASHVECSDVQKVRVHFVTWSIAASRWWFVDFVVSFFLLAATVFRAVVWSQPSPTVRRLQATLTHPRRLPPPQTTLAHACSPSTGALRQAAVARNASAAAAGRGSAAVWFGSCNTLAAPQYKYVSRNWRWKHCTFKRWTSDSAEEVSSRCIATSSSASSIYNALLQNVVAFVFQALRLANSSMMWGHGQKCSQLLAAEQQQLNDQLLTHLQLQCKDMTSSQATLARVTLSRTPQRADVITQTRWRSSRCVGVVIATKPTDFRFLTFLLTLDAIASELPQTIVVNVIISNCDVVCENAVASIREWVRGRSVLLYFHHVSAVTLFKLRYALSSFAVEYPESTLLFTDVTVEMTSQLLSRCASITRKNEFVYQPSNSVTSGQPYSKSTCLHVSNFLSTIDQSHSVFQ